MSTNSHAGNDSNKEKDRDRDRDRDKDRDKTKIETKTDMRRCSRGAHVRGRRERGLDA